jgi:aspartate/methionine/tyrosine aminotransferase
VARPFWLTRLLVRTGIARFLPAARRLTDGGAAFLRYYSDKVLAAPVEELLDPAFLPPALTEPDAIDLNLAAPRFDSAVSLGRVAEAAGRPPASGTAELRNAIADLYVRRDGRAVDPDHEVFVTHGATAAYAAALDALVNPGDRVVLFDPCSPLFSLGAKSRRAAVRWVPAWNEDGRCRFLTTEFEKQMRGAKLLVLSDPANPAGGCLATEDFEYIVWIAAAYDVLVYVDESFTRFRYDGRARSPAVLPGGEKRVLTAGSVSQGHGLGALRVGWLAGPRPLVRACGLTANLSAPFVPAVCQRLAARALGEADADFAPVAEQFGSRRQYVIDRLRGIGLEPDWPGGGYFVWVPVAALGLDGRAFAERLLKEQRVLVGPGCAFGPSGTGHVRISFAADDGRLREGLARLTAFVGGLRNPTPATAVEEAPEEAPPANPGEEPKPVFSRA